MPKLNDTQTILLSTASRRDDLAFYPLEGVAAGARVTKAVASLIKAGLAEQRGEQAVFATIAGLTAIGVETGQGDGHGATEDPASSKPRSTKTAAVRALLKREQGATLPDLIAATGWLPHTVRAALTGLRKKGHAIERAKRDDVTAIGSLADGEPGPAAGGARRHVLRSAQEGVGSRDREPVPRVSPRLLRLALAWEIQAKALGGLSREATRMLDAGY